MAINFTDFSKAPLQESPFDNLLENVLKGYKMSREPAQIKAKEEEQQLTNKQKSLANALSDLALKHKPKEYELADALKVAQTEKAKRAPAGSAGTTKFNSTVANADKIWNIEHPEGATTPELKADYINTLKNAFQVGQQHTEATTARSKDITSGTGFDKLPVDEKKRAIGLTTAMGIDPVEGAHLLRSGKTLEEIAKEKNQDLGDLVPVYPLGTENVKQLQKRSGYVAELKNLEGKVAEPLSKYPAKFRGYSLDQIADSLDNANPDEMGKVLAARALSPEIAALRLKVAGGNIGIEAINELTNKSMQQMNVIEGLVDTPTYLATQKYITEWLEDAANSFQKNQEDYGRLKSKKQNESGIKVYNPATGRLE